MPDSVGLFISARRALAALATVVLLLATLGCAANRSSLSEHTSAFEADGVYVRHVRVRLTPAHTKAFESLMARCLRAAQAADLPVENNWLCYRESPGRYWVLWFGETKNGFVIPNAPDALAGFARHVAGAEGESALEEIVTQLAALDYEIEWNLLSRQKSEWSTVEEMSTATHPKARMMVRSIKSGSHVAFDRALEQRTAFLREHDYRLPIEGFVVLDGAPGTALQVVFPVDWPSFHAADSFGEFIRNLDQATQEAYAQRKAALMVTMDRAEFYDGDFQAELSYRAH